jgi:hypothetical protein
VQVVTTGIDWPSIAAAISGGVVGLAGIIAAVRQSGRTIRAEDARARLADKRRVYASCLAAFAELARARAKTWAYEQSGEVSDEIEDQHAAALKAAMSAYSELQLIAPAKVRKPVYEYFRSLSGDGQADRTARELMVGAMRADLGEPPDQSPEIEPS